MRKKAIEHRLGATICVNYGLQYFYKVRRIVHQLDGLTYKGKKGLAALKVPVAELLTELAKLSPKSKVPTKVRLFKACILRLNELNEKWDHDLLNTDEREDICQLLDEVAIGVGVRPYDNDYQGEWLEEWIEF